MVFVFVMVNSALIQWVRGQKQPATWAADVGNSWRTTMDIMDIWPSILFNLDHNNVWHKYAGMYRIQSGASNVFVQVPEAGMILIWYHLLTVNYVEFLSS